MCKVPVFRPVAIKVLALLAEAETDILHVAELLASDPGFSAELLTIANSSAYALDGRINTVQKAIIVLGTEQTRRLVTRTALQGMVRGIEENAAVKNCWIHSRTAASLAVWLAPAYRVHPDNAYTLALMHDIGRLGLLAIHGGRYADLLHTASGTNAALLEAERAACSIDHCEAGEWLTRTWGIPKEFQEAASTHHRDGGNRAGGYGGLVACACAMAQTLGFTATPQVEGAPLETLLASVPSAGPGVAAASREELLQLAGQELQM